MLISKVMLTLPLGGVRCSSSLSIRGGRGGIGILGVLLLVGGEANGEVELLAGGRAPFDEDALFDDAVVDDKGVLLLLMGGAAAAALLEAAEGGQY